MTLLLWLKYAVAQIWGHFVASTCLAERSAAGWKTPRIAIVDSGRFTVRAATQTTHMACIVQQSGVRASQVQVRKMAIIRLRRRAFNRNATSTAPCATSNIAPAQGFHARGRSLEIMPG